jgi:hypothetical protein
MDPAGWVGAVCMDVVEVKDATHLLEMDKHDTDSGRYGPG